MLRIIGTEVEGVRGANSITFTEVMTVEIAYGRYKRKATLPITNLDKDELKESLRQLRNDVVDQMREWEKIEQAINLE